MATAEFSRFAGILSSALSQDYLLVFIFIVNKAEIDVFLELSCFFDELVDVGNLISGFLCLF